MAVSATFVTSRGVARWNRKPHQMGKIDGDLLGDQRAHG
tara:strand:+ start:360 stop:476 length:117 start_codon:yes stop_codon:yes gene_type:complete